ncbi:MAG TPA: aroma-sacti cluster domain-containing protein [Bryocella sp.]|nr:aroma-sacti cluster domain-containing protein [Bryocella sp.]
MGNIDQLKQAGIIPANASLSQADQDVINSLTSNEVAALISIKGKLTADFIQRNFSGGAAPANRQSLGIVF